MLIKKFDIVVDLAGLIFYCCSIYRLTVWLEYLTKPEIERKKNTSTKYQCPLIESFVVFLKKIK